LSAHLVSLAIHAQIGVVFDLNVRRLIAPAQARFHVAARFVADVGEGVINVRQAFRRTIRRNIFDAVVASVHAPLHKIANDLIFAWRNSGGDAGGRGRSWVLAGNQGGNVQQRDQAPQ
jgi:hypothetical protein